MVAERSSLVVISGASSGIGEATARRLASSKYYRLLLAGRDQHRLEAVSRDCLLMGAEEITILRGDLQDRGYVMALAEEGARRAPLGALVNNAGIGEFGPTSDFSDEAWDRVVAVNLSAVFFLCRELAPLLSTGGNPGTIVNVSSDADLVGFSEAAAYCASKGALLAMSRALRLELRPKGVRVCTVSPGRVDTRFNRKDPGMRPGALEPDEVAEVIQFAIRCSRNIELQEVRLDSMSRLDQKATT
jgi:NAD(P)-dependent dehydrogenase (short-subunit alcohol dehydrogenase family)